MDDGVCVSPQKAPGLWVWGRLPFPLLRGGGARKGKYTLTACVTACQTIIPKAAKTLGESLGGGTVGQVLARLRQWTKCPRGRTAGRRRYPCSLTASTQVPTLSSGWGLREAENGHHLPTEAWGPASPCPAPRASEEAPAQGTLAPSGETHFGEGSASHTHTSPV